MNVYTLAEVAELERDLNETDGAFTRDGALEALEQMLPNEFRRYGFGSYAWGDSGTLCGDGIRWGLPEDRPARAALPRAGARHG
jgi:hypothetical protein